MSITVTRLIRPPVVIALDTTRINICNGHTSWLGAWVGAGVDAGNMYAAWTNAGGDWVDLNGIAQGTTPWASAAMATPSSASLTGTLDISGIDGDIILFGVNISSYAKIDGAAAQAFWIIPSSSGSIAFPSHYLSPIMIENPGRGRTLTFDYYSTDGTARAFKIQGPVVTDYPTYIGTSSTPDIWSLELTSEAAIRAAANAFPAYPAGRIDEPLTTGGAEFLTDPTGIAYMRTCFDPAYNGVPDGGNRNISWRFDYGSDHSEIYTRFLVYLEDDVTASITDGVKMHAANCNELNEQASELIAYRINHGTPSRTNPGIYGLLDYLYDAEFGGSGVPASRSLNAFLRTNRWYCIEVGVRMNTPGVSDGYGEVRVNGHTTWTTTTARYRNNALTKINGGHGIVNSKGHYRFAKFAAGTSWCGVPAELLSTTVPTWRSALTVKDVWGVATSQTFSGCVGNEDGSDNAQLELWNGGCAYNGKWYMAMGGGHSSNLHNQVWLLDFNQNAPTWSRIHAGSDPRDYRFDHPYYYANYPSLGAEPLGQVLPGARHTYYTIQYVQGTQGRHDHLMLIFAGAYGGSGSDPPDADSYGAFIDGFDLVTNKWEPKGTYPALGYGIQYGQPVSVHPTTQDVFTYISWPYLKRWRQSTNDLVDFGFSGDMNGGGVYAASVIDASRNRMMIWQPYAVRGVNTIGVTDLGTWTATSPTLTGLPQYSSAGYLGGDPQNQWTCAYGMMVHDTINDRYLAALIWVDATNTWRQSVFAIDPITWNVTYVSELPFTIPNLPVDSSINGRFMFHPTLGGCSWTAHYSSPTYFMPVVNG